MINTTYAVTLTGDVTIDSTELTGGVKFDNALRVSGDAELFSQPEHYRGDYTVTPIKADITLYTDNLLMDGDVLIRAIPDLYIDTTIESGGAGAGQILNGYKGYVNGVLVEGNAVTATATYDGEGITLTNGFPVEVGNG